MVNVYPRSFKKSSKPNVNWVFLRRVVFILFLFLCTKKKKKKRERNLRLCNVKLPSHCNAHFANPHYKKRNTGILKSDNQKILLWSTFTYNDVNHFTIYILWHQSDDLKYVILKNDENKQWSVISLKWSVQLKKCNNCWVTWLFNLNKSVTDFTIWRPEEDIVPSKLNFRIFLNEISAH